MSAGNRLASNVTEFLDVAAKWHGRLEAESFSQEMFCDCLELDGVKDSPIEQLFWIALRVVALANVYRVADDWDCDPETGVPDGGRPASVILCSHQFHVGHYRADFGVALWKPRKKPDELTWWLVELDGHEFHDKDERQRRYEKRRDRHFTTQGYKVLHFTGAEVVRDPFKVAQEVLIAVTGDDEIVTPAEYFG